jgi:hypothetical protein
MPLAKGLEWYSECACRSMQGRGAEKQHLVKVVDAQRCGRDLDLGAYK